MKSSLARRCARRAPQQQPLTAWARSVVAEPALHYASRREAGIIAALLLELDLEATR